MKKEDFNRCEHGSFEGYCVQCKVLRLEQLNKKLEDELDVLRKEFTVTNHLLVELRDDRDEERRKMAWQFVLAVASRYDPGMDIGGLASNSWRIVDMFLDAEKGEPEPSIGPGVVIYGETEEGPLPSPETLVEANPMSKQWKELDPTTTKPDHDSVAENKRRGDVYTVTPLPHNDSIQAVRARIEEFKNKSEK